MTENPPGTPDPNNPQRPNDPQQPPPSGPQQPYPPQGHTQNPNPQNPNPQYPGPQYPNPGTPPAGDPSYGMPGGYPPPPGYGTQPAGGYPPPPPGNYGAPIQGQPGFGGPGGTPQLTVSDALGYAWSRYKANAGVWIGFSLIAVLIDFAVSWAFDLIDAYNTSDIGDYFEPWRIVGTIVTVLVGYLIGAAFVRGALDEVDGVKPDIGSFFRLTNVGAIILASFLVSVIIGVGLILFIIPGIILAFLTWWTLQFVIDRDNDAIGGIKASFDSISQNVGPLALLALVLVALNLVGVLLCGIGLLVTYPLAHIATAYAYRVATGGHIAR